MQQRRVVAKASPGGGTPQWAFVALGFAAAIAAAVLAGRKARAMLAQKGIDARAQGAYSKNITEGTKP